MKTQYNVTQPTSAQEQFIPILLKGQRDLLLRDRTGTGKTFGTALTLSSLVPKHSRSNTSVASLYIVPNQELAFQIGHWMNQLTDNNKQIQVLASNEQDLPDFTPHTVIGTPGRILDLMSQGQLPLTGLERLILDEADQALSLPPRYATKRQQEKRVKHPKPAERLLDELSSLRHQTCISSATLNRPLRFFLTKQKGWLNDPLFIDLVQGSQLDNTRNATVKHHCLVISDDNIRNIQTNKELLLTQKLAEFDDLDDRMIESVAVLQDLEPVNNGILFIDPTVSVASIKQKLTECDVNAQDIKDYTPNTNTLWIATEFTARGVDIPGVSHVFILGKPASPTSYLHMAGRTGRLSPNGFAQGKVIELIRENGWTESKMLNMYELLNIPVQSYENVD